MVDTPFQRTFLHPRYWLTWLGFALWWSLVQLPLRVQTFLANRMGDAIYWLRPLRARVAERNLELAFPRLDAVQRRRLLRQNLRHTAMGFFETGISWWWPTEKILAVIDFEGQEHLEQLQSGVLIAGVHFTCLEIAGVVMSAHYPLDMVYRPHDNALYDTFQQRGRTSNGRRRQDGQPPSRMFDRNDLRGMVRALKSGRIIWSTFDQDASRRKGVFVPFFGIPASTYPAAGTIARLAGVPAIPLLMFRRPNGRYCVRILPPIAEFPTGEAVQDARRYNVVAESLIGEHPEAYLWVHRRYKTRPEGEPDLYAGLDK